MGLSLATGTFAGLALWLCPADRTQAATGLTSLLDELADQHSTPHFSPHVTLLSGISIDAPIQHLSEQVHSVAESTAPFRLELSGVGTHGTYFQYVFAKVEASSALLKLRQQVGQAVLPGTDGSEYFPHLSLVYGQDSETLKARDIVKEIEASKDERLQGFEVSGVKIVRCQGRPEEWRVIENVPFERS